MKIAIIGAGGNIGQRITQEAASRNHNLLLITSKDNSFFGLSDAETQSVDIFETSTLAKAIQESDVVISAYAPPHENTDLLTGATRSLVEAAKTANVRLIAVGGAGSLTIGNEVLVETPDFPAAHRPIPLAHKKVLEDIYQKEADLNWTNVSPSAYIFEGERTNQFRTGKDELLTDEKGESRISMEDFAVGILNEVEEGNYPRQRFTIGY